MKKILQINYFILLRKILSQDNAKFFQALSFLIISLITIHVSIYNNFYKFTSNWIEKEQRKITIIISPHANEKKVPLQISNYFKDTLQDEEHVLNFKTIDNQMIKDSLGLESISQFSDIKIPFIIQIELYDTEFEKILNKLKKNLDGRRFQEIRHKNQIFEISDLIEKIKLTIVIMFILVSILFAFLILSLTRAMLTSNFKFLQMLQILGANSYNLSKTISLNVIKLIAPNSILSIFFVSIITYLVLSVLAANIEYFESFSLTQISIKNFFLLVVFLLFFLVLLFASLTAYLFYFFEKRFFDKI